MSAEQSEAELAELYRRGREDEAQGLADRRREEGKEVDEAQAAVAPSRGGLDESKRPTCQTPGCDELCHVNRAKTGWFDL